ncbi:MAG TPA: L-seryl-tRNA(Sec) selenium transferase, partial [Synergistales bacterium]|nr:L-seryl-tRNA(Sec) selenium transferase [Synergistales bacterium]
MTGELKGKLRDIPSMDILLNRDWVDHFMEELGRDAVKSVLKEVIDSTRQGILEGSIDEVDPEEICRRALILLERKKDRSLKRVVNATGVIVHTNLGRSCLAEEAVKAVTEVSGFYNTLEYDLSRGQRGQRNDHVEWLLCQVTGAEAAVVVNNNAGAVMLCLAALARDKEVLVSRGELVEIGGSFRVPEIMSFSGARLVEVGATNRTHLSDYSQSITPETAMVMKVHPSNFRIEGFTSEVSREELSLLSRDKGLLFLEDLGSGVLIDVEKFGLSGEPKVGDCLAAGVDLVTFSGDKMLGGPQIGGVVGKKEIIDRLRKYPLLRALRVDKMTLAAFECTLRLYLQDRWTEIPTLQMLSMTLQDMKRSATGLAVKLRKIIPNAEIKVIQVEDAVGGGAFPTTRLPGYGVAIRNHPWGSAGALQQFLRSLHVPVITGARED